ncbi:hypothetical protein K0M31_018488 [Melipona bicolor]|uniref:Lysine-specific demethylase 3B PWWP domain-containing protein n=1 Tax=Melipona bicolor TaxID=60889 RepID=A0AA40G3P3_9HYME|nr:hypothetical protein K0M31_018488 [Melipona bicolor]
MIEYTKGQIILVEYDDVEWQRREWLSPHRDAVFSFFLVEKGLCWAERPDPRHASLIAIDHHNHANNNHHHHRINGKPLRGATAVANTVAWPALTFYPLVARAELPEDAMPLEFMQDRRLDFVDYSKLKPFTRSDFSKVRLENFVCKRFDVQKLLMLPHRKIVGAASSVHKRRQVDDRGGGL